MRFLISSPSGEQSAVLRLWLAKKWQRDYALVDLRALETLKELKGADFTYKLLHNIMGELRFDCYPKEASKLLELREAVAKELK